MSSCSLRGCLASSFIQVFFFYLLLSVSFLRTVSQVWDSMNAPVLLGLLPDVSGLCDPVVLVALLQNVLGFFPVPDMADFRFSSFAFPFLAPQRRLLLTFCLVC